jgi:mannitol operon transcriptional activator
VLDFKDNYILKQLVASDTILTISELQKDLEMSQRSIYYSLERINDYLSRIELPMIINKRGVGLLIHDKVIEHFNRNELIIKDVYICTSKERNNLQVLYILSSEEYINISLLMEMFNVSRSTIIKDLREIRQIVSKYNLVLEYNIENGYEIHGSEIQKRSLILVINSDYKYLIQIKSISYYDDNDVDELMSLFIKVEEKLNVIYVRSTLHQLAVLLAIIKKTNRPKVIFEDEDETFLLNANEYEVVSNIFKDFIGPHEFTYLVMHLLALRIQYSKNTQRDGEDKYVGELVNYIMNEFYNLTLIDIKHRDELFHNLYTHMKPALFRFKYSIIYRNELKDQIINEFSQVYRVTNIIIKKLEKIIDYIIGEDEIAYIAIYFGSMIEKEQQMVDHPRVLLVCLNGKALARNLKREIESFTKDVVIVDAFRESDTISLKDKVDYIISTEPIKDLVSRAKTMVVNPILNDRERYRIINFLGLSNTIIYNTEMIDRMMNDINDYIIESKRDEVKEIINYYLNK